MNCYNLTPNGCPNAGFYADLGHTLTHNLGRYLNEIYSCLNTNNFIVNIDSTKMWKKYQLENKLSIDYYKEMFQIDLNYNLPLPVTGLLKDNWTIIKDTNFNDLNNILKKYFKLSDKQQIKYDNLIHKYNFNPKNTIGVYYRGTDKFNETFLESPNSYIEKVKELLHAEPHLKIMIQTDQEQVKDLFIKTFLDKIFYIEELPTSLDNTGVHQKSNKEIDKYALATYFDLALRLLSQCKYLVLGISNSSTFIGAYRNNSANVYQFTKRVS